MRADAGRTVAIRDPGARVRRAEAVLDYVSRSGVAKRPAETPS